MKFADIQSPVPHSDALYEQYRQLSQLALKLQINGLRIDTDAVKEHQKAATERKEKFGRLFRMITSIDKLGEDGQTDEVKRWFWVTKGLPQNISKKSKKPQLDTNESLVPWLTDIDDSEVNNAAAALIGYRKATKALSMLKAYMVPNIHPDWNVTGTKGSRWTSSNPNIMQLSSKDVKYTFPHGIETVAVNLKNIIIPRAGYIFVGSDYSALELYLQTYLAGASKLLEWIKLGEDLHLNNATLFFGEARVPWAHTKEQIKEHKKKFKLEREVAKLGFGFSYNVTEHIRTVVKQMRGKMPGLNERTVKEFRHRYFEAHAEFPAWQRRTVDLITKQQFIEIGLMKRRLYLEDSPRGYNQAMNAQCQTLGGDMLNFAALRIAKSQTLALSWYDSLTLEVIDSQDAIQQAAGELTEAMAGPFPVNGLQAKFVAEADWGPNLRDMVPL